jgi:hypothetical protein
VLVLLGKAPFFGMAAKAEPLTLCRQQPWMAGSVGPMAGEALSCLVRFMSVRLGHEPFLTSVTVLAQFADLFFEQLFMLRGMGIVTARTPKLLKRIMGPFLSQLLLNIRVARQTRLEADIRFARPTRLRSQEAYEGDHKKCQITG